MLSDFRGADRVYIACGYTDLRRGIDGLAELVRQQFQLDPFSNTLFLFCGRKRDRIKALYWEGNGFLLLYKRLEQGVYQWPRSENEARELTAQQYRWLMEGLKVDQPKAHRDVMDISLGRLLRHNGELFQRQTARCPSALWRCGKSPQAFAQIQTAFPLLRRGMPFSRAVVDKRPTLAADYPQAK